MRIKLAYKLFGAFLLILVIVAGAILVSRYIFTYNFKTFIHQMEMERMVRLATELQEIYHSQGGWDHLRNDERQWHLLTSGMEDMGAPPPPMEFTFNGHPPPPPHSGGPPGGPPGPPGLVLMNAAKEPIVGATGPVNTDELVAIEVDNQVVGWLGQLQREPFKFGPPAAFIKRQNTDLFILGGIVVALTALVALLFSRHLLRPIQRLMQATHDLAGLNFAVRITPDTQDELGRLAENFNVMAQTLEKYELRQRQWLTDISHELRTPLSVLRGEIEALQDGIRKADSESLASLHAESLRIGQLVNDLHLLSMADSDTLLIERQWMYPFKLLHALLIAYSDRFAQRGITLNPQLEPIQHVRLKADTNRLGQVFTNLLENAYRYVYSPGILNITGKADEKYLTLWFNDSGPGVPEKDLPRLFDRLFRVETSRNRESGGSGLGLSICRRIVENHNGRIWSANNHMGGLTIGISLPLNG